MNGSFLSYSGKKNTEDQNVTYNKIRNFEKCGCRI